MGTFPCLGCAEPFAAALPLFVFPLQAPAAANVKCEREHTQNLIFKKQHAKEPARLRLSCSRACLL